MALLQDLDELVLDALREPLIPCTNRGSGRWHSFSSSSRGARGSPILRTNLPHAETNERLRQMGFPHVQLAYDGLQFEVQTRRGGCSEPRAAGAPSRVTLVEDPSSRPTGDVYVLAGLGLALCHLRHASVLAIGNFDGIHLGHQAILRATVERAQALNAISTVLTFDPSPRKVLRPESAPLRLSTIAQRLEWFNALGIEAAVVMPFTLELSRLSPEEFVEQILVRDLV